MVREYTGAVLDMVGGYVSVEAIQYVCSYAKCQDM